MSDTETRFRKAPLPDVYGNPQRYGEFSYAGAAGSLMGLNHRLMERGIRPEDNVHVVDVGGASMPHWRWMNLRLTRSYHLVDDARSFAHVSVPDALGGIDVRMVDHGDPDGLEPPPGGFSRIIASHVMEHIHDPEEALLRWCGLLRDDGILSIAIPCDPGWSWRLLQHLSLRSAIRTLGFANKRERDLFQSRDHVTSAANILKVLRFYFGRLHIVWFPTLLPVIDFNVLCVIRASMTDFRL